MHIDSIKNGIVIDHITAGRGMELYHLLGLDKLDCSIAIIKNVSSINRIRLRTYFAIVINVFLLVDGFTDKP